MTMEENCEQLRSLIQYKFDKKVEFYALPKTNNSQELLENEMAVSLLQNKNLRHFFKGNQLIIPVFRSKALDGAAIIIDGAELSREECLQITDLVELLITDIMTLESESDLLRQSTRQLENQARQSLNISLESLSNDIVH
ncbi:MAG: hypothetical protein VX583_05430 [Bdellovibrionota bacterium]